MMHDRYHRLYVIAALLALAVPVPRARAQSSSFLDNGTIKVGVDLTVGGAIYYLSQSGTTNNVINIADLGRYVQQSYYSGPQPFGSPSPSWPNWPWNPIQVGDCYNNKAKIIAHTNDGTTIYTKSIPKQWALNNVDGDCTFEQWTTLDGTAVNVRCRLNNLRSDQTWYGGYDQEKPAVYTVGTLYKLFTYTGSAPFTSGALTEIVNQGPPWAGWTATENWAAQVNASNWGVGTFKSGAYRFIGGFAGTKGSGGPTSSNTGYIAPLSIDILDHHIVYDFDATLILGDLATIRSYVYQHAPNTKPNYRFLTDRQNFTMNGTDTGTPIAGQLSMKLDTGDPYIVGPLGYWDASAAPVMYVRMALTGTTDPACQMFFLPAGGTWSEANSLPFTAIPDGQVHTYALALNTVPSYAGGINQIRLDPTNGGVAGARANIVSITSDALTGTMAINGGAATTTTPSVTLALTATSFNGNITQMRFSSDNLNWTGWEPYAPSKAWTLSSDGGLKSVYAQYQDDTGAVSSGIPARIVLDTTLWSDGFESNNFTAGGWTNSGTTIQSTYKYMNTYTAYFNSSDSLTKSFSTVGKSNIRVEYARYTRNCTSTSHFIAEWYNGSVWTVLEDQAGNSAWAYKSFALPAGAANNANFRVRFRTTNTSTRYAYLDNVVIRGTTP